MGGQFSLPAPSEKERSEALANPGPSWRDWVYGSMLKVYIPLGFVIVDVWIVGTWLEDRLPLGNDLTVLGIALSLAPALYLEYAAFLYFWASAKDDPSHSIRETEGFSLLHPFRVGRWTEAGRRLRRGLPPRPGAPPEPAGPNPEEFF